jgi:hypothetical protein
MLRLQLKGVSPADVFDPIEVPDSATISDVKNLLATRHHCAASLIRIIHQRNMPSDDTTLVSAGIVDNSTLTVYLPKKAAGAASASPASSLPHPNPDPKPAFTPPEPLLVSPPHPIVPSTASSTIRSIDDPSLPDYVRHPIERLPLSNPHAIAQLEEMGYPHRAVLNALRYVQGNIDQAGNFLAAGIFSNERVNELVEQLTISNSGVTQSQMVPLTVELVNLASQVERRDRARLGDARQLFEGLSLPQKILPPKPFTIAEVGPFLEGSGELTVEQEGKLEALCTRNPSKRQELRDLVVRVRNANSVSDEDFRNPFAVGLGTPGSVSEAVFGRDWQGFAVGLTTRQCRYLLGKMGEGLQFPGICETMQLCDLNLETVDEILANDLQPSHY